MTIDDLKDDLIDWLRGRLATCEKASEDIQYWHGPNHWTAHLNKGEKQAYEDVLKKINQGGKR
jgi:hypothetical protein